MIFDGDQPLRRVFDGDQPMRQVFDGEFGVIYKPTYDKHYSYEQAQPSDVWEIHHNLQKYPSVSIVDTANTAIIADVDYVDINTVRISFNSPTAGYAYFN